MCGRPPAHTGLAVDRSETCPTAELSSISLMGHRTRGAIGYIALILACFSTAMVAGWNRLAGEVDVDVYDWMFRRNPPAGPNPKSVVLAIDDVSLNAMGGMRNLRTILAQALETLAPARPKLVAIDVVLADEGDRSEDERLERAFEHTRNLILPTVLDSSGWESPRPQFRKWAAAVGHAYADGQSKDGVTRQIALEVAANRERFWALALEAFRIERSVKRILESPEDLQIGDTVVPARRSEGRPLRVRYVRDGIPRYSVKSLLEQPALREAFRNKAVFLGVYSTTAARDRVVTPLGGDLIVGLEVNAQAFETLERRDFFTDASDTHVLLFCAVVAILAGLIFARFSGWPAYLLAATLLGCAHLTPFVVFQHAIVFPYFAPLSSAWLTVAGAASYQHFVVRRQLRQSESERTRYRQAIHFVTHEMRTPLTAIQGSSELIGRYNLNDEKRKQIATMINSESKRLARMIQTFLDVERLSDGQLEVKNEPFAVRDVVEACLERVRAVAERKTITIQVDNGLEGSIRGDRELMEYAVYNLLTNAVKYSPPDTEVLVSSRPDHEFLRLSVKDQGMGMDDKELRKIFERFYRTKRAEASGEQGSGIGLSIVEQIVKHHGGRVEVTSTPGKGSCFTVVVPACVAILRG